MIIRPAQPGDRAALEAIAAQTWDGDDYLPRVLDEWLSDPNDGFFVADFRGRAVGVSKITRQGKGEWWLEGLRVDPAYRRAGVGRILHHFMLNQLRQTGRGMVRYSTASDNQASLRLGYETGFQCVGIFRLYEAEPLHEPETRLAALGPGDLGRVRAWLDQSEVFARSQHGIEHEWVWLRLTDERLAERLAAGLVYGWPGPQDDLAGVLIANGTEQHERYPENALKLAYLDAAPDALEALGTAARRLAAAQGREWAGLKFPDWPERAEILERAGWERAWDENVLLLQRDLNLTEQADVRVETLPSPPE